MAKQLSAARKRALLTAAHTPAARRKAQQTIVALHEARHDLARRYKVAPTEFAKDKLLATLKRLGVHPTKVPLIVLKPLGKLAVRKALNGGSHPTHGTSIPLDAIPERAKPNANGRGPYVKRGHPNAALIEKVLDQLATKGTSDKIATRLLTVLDKLLA